jgi:hypothetical protein
MHLNSSIESLFAGSHIRSFRRSFDSAQQSRARVGREIRKSARGIRFRTTLSRFCSIYFEALWIRGGQIQRILKRLGKMILVLRLQSKDGALYY